jgi:hypothetical protein
MSTPFYYFTILLRYSLNIETVVIVVTLLDPEIPCFTQVFIVKMWTVVYYHYQCDYNEKRC